MNRSSTCTLFGKRDAACRLVPPARAIWYWSGGISPSKLEALRSVRRHRGDVRGSAGSRQEPDDPVLCWFPLKAGAPVGPCMPRYRGASSIGMAYRRSPRWDGYSALEVDGDVVESAGADSTDPGTENGHSGRDG